mmetsp:Transcript_25041/g.37000  ORF Transcript_25041/g.37000 Transcript_25041/m.37000 type:complete len:195 (+) Transcript_25041:62-646(+)
MNNHPTSDTYGWPVKVYRHTKDRGWETATSDLTMLLASPCIGGVELRQLRVRIRIFPKNSDEQASTTNTTRCTKRRNLLFLSTRKCHSGSIVLKFHNVETCNEFFDELTKLNIDKIRKFDKTNNEEEQNNKPDENEERLQIQRRRDTLDYLIRLLTDEGFGRFVNQVERSLTSTEDGARMLTAFRSSRIEEEDD